MMEDPQKEIIWTVGHSTRGIDQFIAMLKSFHIELLADVRSYAGSRRYPHFNKEALEISLAKENIQYVHLIDLGGRRKPKPDSKNIAWRNDAFRGYADYMESDSFKKAVEHLQLLAEQNRSAYMC